MGVEQDFKTLGLAPNAGWEAVKSAFRRLARTYHPDISGPHNAKKFSEITNAYLSIKEHYAMSPHQSTSGVNAASSGWSETDTPQSGGIFQTITGLFNIFGSKKKKQDEKKQQEEQTHRQWAEEEKTRQKEQEKQAEIYKRDKTLDEVLSRAEDRLERLYNKCAQLKMESGKFSLLQRLNSSHPKVVLLATEELSRSADKNFINESLGEILSAPPGSEILSCILKLFPDTDGLISKFVCKHSGEYEAEDAINVVKWLRGKPASLEKLKLFLAHPSLEVVKNALHCWPSGERLPDVAQVRRILENQDAELLLELFRLLRREGAPLWTIPIIKKISTDHAAVQVRVWAGAIVRDGGVGYNKK